MLERAPWGRVMDFDAAFRRCPLIAILRGITPTEALAVGEALVHAGLTLIEVPLDAPDAMRSVATIAEVAGDRALVGAGGVLRAQQLDAVLDAGGRLVVCPHTDLGLIDRAARLGMTCLPGVLTPTEAICALDGGAEALLLFPAQGSSPAALAAMMTTLPKDTRIVPVGGITPDAMGRWWAAGARGFGLGGSLYHPGRSAKAVGERARACVAAVTAPLDDGLI